MKRLEGSQVVVLGGSGWIGLATAKRALEEGAAVAIVGRSTARLREVDRVLGLVT